MTQIQPLAPHPSIYLQRIGFEPAPELREVREGTGIQKIVTPFGMPAYLVTRHNDIKDVLADADHFSTERLPRFRALPGAPDITPEEQQDLAAGNLLETDPPEHHRLRRMLTPEFTLRRMRRLEPRITEIVDQHLDGMERAGAPADLVSSFTLPIPSLVICELLGVPYADREEFQQRSARQFDLTVSAQERFDLQQKSRAYMDTLVTSARQDPGEDMLGMLVREHGADLTQAELAGIAALLLIAGHETTSNMLALGTLALLQNPDQLSAVREDPQAVGSAIEELLRYLTVVHSGMPRLTTADIEIAGVPISAGELVVLSLTSGNRDPHFIDEPDTLDIHRGAPGHLAFGHGIHHCLGAPLARMEMSIAFPALLRRFPKLALAGRFTDVEFRAYHLFFGLHSLKVTW